MPQPTASSVHVNVPLTNISIAFLQDPGKFVADKVFPIVPVQKQSDRYYEYDRPAWLRDEAKLRAPSTESAGGGWTLTNTATYFCDVVAYHKDIDDQVRANADSVINMDRDATAFVIQKILLKREVDFAATFFTTGVWTTDQTGVAAAPAANQFLQWDQSASTPVEDIEAQRTAILGLTGFEPNVLLVGRHVFKALKNHPDILDRIKYGGTSANPAIVTPAMLAEVFGVEKFLIANAIKDTSLEGATAAPGFIFGKAALLCYAPASPGLLTPTAGYIFAWTGLEGANAFGTRINTFRADLIKSDRVEAEAAYDMVKIAADLGKFFTAAVA
jgi:hypothetical protein